MNRLNEVKFLAKLINNSIDLKLFNICVRNPDTNKALNELFSFISDQIFSNLIALTLSDDYGYEPCPLELSWIATVCTQLRSLHLSREYRCGFHEYAIIQIVRNSKYLQNSTLHGCVCKTVLMTVIATNCSVFDYTQHKLE